MFLIPLGLYLLWASLYSLKIFVCSAKKIKERNYETMYVYYIQQPWAERILYTFGRRFAPLVFMSLHVTFFVISSIFAILGYTSFYIHTAFLLMWITLSIWNGANFYMEYFSRKYESSLKALD
jgi:hypothetical protein